MRAIKYIIFCSIILTTNLFAEAQTEQERVQQAYQSQQALKFEQAIQQYESLMDDGYVSADIFFNTGMAYYDNGDLGKAILFLEKAKRQAPYDKEVTTNLDLLQNEQEDGLLPLPTFFLKAWWNNWSARLSPNTWGVLVILFSILAALSFSAWTLGKMPQWRKYQLMISPILLILAVFFFSLGQNRKQVLANQNQGVITPSVVDVYIAPGDDADVDGQVHGGLKVDILDQFESWVKIRMVDGREGWVAKNKVGVI